MPQLGKRILIVGLALGVVAAGCGGGSGQADYSYGTYDDEGYYEDEYENWQADQAYEEYQQDLYDRYAEEDLRDRYYDDLDRYDFYDGIDQYRDYGNYPDYGDYSSSGGQGFGSSSEGGNEASGCPYGCTVHAVGCDIKGNVSYETSERIYHLPGEEFYAQTVINPAYGERWFCTEAEAVANGWRRSLR